MSSSNVRGLPPVYTELPGLLAELMQEVSDKDVDAKVSALVNAREGISLVYKKSENPDLTISIEQRPGMIRKIFRWLVQHFVPFYHAKREITIDHPQIAENFLNNFLQGRNDDTSVILRKYIQQRYNVGKEEQIKQAEPVPQPRAVSSEPTKEEKIPHPPPPPPPPKPARKATGPGLMEQIRKGPPLRKTGKSLISETEQPK
jgi:hypothetical protein